jgi:hypothetical protein
VMLSKKEIRLECEMEQNAKSEMEDFSSNIF